MLKKMMTLALAVGALVAFAAPSVASADTWTVGGNNIGSSTATGTNVTGTGSISATLTVAAGNVQLGPCGVHASATLWNNSGVAHGEINSLTITTPCDVFLNGTKICTITTAFSQNFPWTVSSSGTNVSIAGANFTDVLSANCPLGPGASATGTATGTFSGSTISLNGTKDDMETPTGAAVDLDGSVLLEGPEEEAVTMH